MKIISLILVSMAIFSCNSNTHSQIKPQNESPQAVSLHSADISYFEGRWSVVERYRAEHSNEKIPISNCEKKSFWEFRKERSRYIQKKHTAKLPNCDQFAVTKAGDAKFAENTLFYNIDDVRYTEDIKIISNKRFSISSREPDHGAMTTFITVYEKR